MRSTGSSKSRGTGALLAGALALGGLVGLGAQASTAPPASAQASGAVNPFTSAGGFTVYAQRDAYVGNTELEGSLAVGRDLARTTPEQLAVIHVAAGTADYTIPTVDGDPTRVLAGRFDPDTSENLGSLNITSAGATTDDNVGTLKLVDRDLGPFETSPRGSDWVRVALPGSNPPLIDATAQTYPADAEPPTGENTSIFTEQTGDTRDVVAGYVEAEQDATVQESAECLATITDPDGHDANHVTVAEDVGERKVLSPLASDRPNVVPYELVAGADVLQFSSGSATPGRDNPLIIHVPEGTTEVEGLRVDPQGQYSPYVLWDLSAVTGDVTVSEPGGRIDGSVYAPFADVTVEAAPLDGQVIGRDVTLRGGEVHSFLFASTIPCGQPRGTFELSKDLSGIDADDLPEGTRFPVDWTATSPDGEELATGTLELPADGAPVSPEGMDGTVRTFPVDTQVTFDEQPPDDVPGWTWAEPAITPNPVTIIADGDAVVSATVTNTAERVEGTFEVTKTVTDGTGGPIPPSPGAVFTVDWSAVDPDGNASSGTIDLVSDAAWNFQPQGPVSDDGEAVTFPVGTEITLSEPGLPDPPEGFTWGEPSWSPDSTFTISMADQMVDVDLVNLLVPQSAPAAFSLHKVVDVDGPVDPDLAFDVEYTFDEPGGERDVATTQVTAGEPVTISVLPDGEPIPAGTTVWVREVAPTDGDVVWDEPVISVGDEPLADPDADGFSPVELTGDETVAIEVTNTGQAADGTFQLTKSLRGPQAEDVPTGLDFSVGWTATYPDGTTMESSTTLAPDGTPAGPTDTDGEEIRFPVGTTVTFDEANLPDLPGWDWGEPSITPSEITVAGGETAQVSVTNEAAVEHGTFEVSKALEGVEPGDLSTDSFDVDWTATLPDGSTTDGVLQVPADGTPAEPDREFPVGTTVHVTEQRPPDDVLPDGWWWATPTWSPGSSIVVDEGTGTASFTVTNSAVPVTSIRVEKAVDGPAPVGTRYDVEYRIDDGPVRHGELAPGDPLRIDDVHLGATVTFLEADPPAVDDASWRPPRWEVDGEPLELHEDGSVSFLADDDELVEAGLTNTLRPDAPADPETPTAPDRPQDASDRPQDAPDRPQGELPRTGFDGVGTLLLGAGLVLLGAVLRRLSRGVGA